jgi:3-hydroxyacyl-[acyl-carrier-protein] dehydratase
MKPEDLQKALELLPHGPEFRFVQRITRLEPGRLGVGEYVPGGDEPFFRGHFPGNPLMPGVLLIEAAAQLAGVVARTDPGFPSEGMLMLAAVRAAKISGTARPGDCVILHAEITARLGNVVQAKADATVNGRTVLQAELTLAAG